MLEGVAAMVLVVSLVVADAVSLEITHSIHVIIGAEAGVCGVGGRLGPWGTRPSPQCWVCS